MAFFVKITPPLTFSSSEPLVENVVNVVSVVSQNRILPKNRFRITRFPIPFFLLLKVLVSSWSESRFDLLKVLVSPFSKFRFFLLRVHFPSSPSSSFLPDSRSRPLRPLPSSQSPLPSSSESRSHPLRFTFPSSSSSPILFVLSHPIPPSQRKQRNDTKPSRRSRGGKFQNGTYQVRQSA